MVVITCNNNSNSGNSNTEVTEVTAENSENTRVFQHTDPQTGIARPMGEGEVRRMIRIYEKRVAEQNTKLLEMIVANETPEMIEKKRAVVENNTRQKQYWNEALEQVTAVTVGNTTETVQLTQVTDVFLRKAA